MHSSLTKKLAAYGSVAALLSLTAKSSEAQIIYTDVNPDFEATGDTVFNLDLDNNGIVDFEVKLLINTSGGAIRIYPDGSNEVIVQPGSTLGYYYPVALASGATIGSTGEFAGNDVRPFFTMASVGYDFVGPYGEWFDVSSGFLGLKFLGADSLMHYGWCRMDAPDSAATFIVKDYAYQLNPDEMILAGDGVNAVHSIPTFDATIFSAGKEIHVELLNTTGKFNAMVTALSGVTMFSVSSSENNLVIDGSEWPQGKYIVSVIQNDRRTAKKVLLF